MKASVKRLLLKAVEHALAGDWQSAHLIVQEHEGERLADWIHAVAHRMEGDRSNASYWYRRIGGVLREDSPPGEELRRIRAELEG